MFYSFFSFLYWQLAVFPFSSYILHSFLYCLFSVFRSSFPFQAITPVLQTALTLALKMTALSTRRQGPAVPVHISASTAGAAATVIATVAVALAALHKLKWRSSLSVMSLRPACLLGVQQRAAAARHQLLEREIKTQRIHACDALLSLAVVTGHLPNCCVFYLIHCCMFSVMKKYSLWCHPFQEQPSGLSR